MGAIVRFSRWAVILRKVWLIFDTKKWVLYWLMVLARKVFFLKSLPVENVERVVRLSPRFFVNKNRFVCEVGI